MKTFQDRQNLVIEFGTNVKHAFPSVTQYNIIVFGSFLTETYTPQSDIDIAVFSLDPVLRRKLYWYTLEYFEKLEIESDVIEIRLSDTQYIAANAILDHKYEVTDYVPKELIQYIEHMIGLYGNDPMKYAMNQLCNEVNLNGGAWR